jgi:hypothetical protein
MLYFRIVPAFEEVDVVEQASGEEQSPMGSGPDVGVVEPKPVISFEQGKCNTPGVYHQLGSGFKLKHDKLVEITMPKSNLWK